MTCCWNNIKAEVARYAFLRAARRVVPRDGIAIPGRAQFYVFAPSKVASGASDALVSQCCAIVKIQQVYKLRTARWDIRAISAHRS
jgi:hypothetical protein